MLLDTTTTLTPPATLAVRVGPRTLTPMSSEIRNLVAAADEGDQEAWNALVDRFAGLVWHVIRGFRLPNAVGEDIYQTTWLRAAEHLSRIRQPESIGGWLARTAKNECLRALRHRQREQLHSDPGLVVADPAASAERSTLDASRNEVLWGAFEKLPAKCQQLLRVLLVDPPLPYEDVSELLDMPIGSIGPTRARCLQRLRSSRELEQVAYES